MSISISRSKILSRRLRPDLQGIGAEKLSQKEKVAPFSNESNVLARSKFQIERTATVKTLAPHVV